MCVPVVPSQSTVFRGGVLFTNSNEMYHRHRYAILPTTFQNQSACIKLSAQYLLFTSESTRSSFSMLPICNPALGSSCPQNAATETISVHMSSAGKSAILRYDVIMTSQSRGLFLWHGVDTLGALAVSGVLGEQHLCPQKVCRMALYQLQSGHS